jgi:hypothetical protein
MVNESDRVKAWNWVGQERELSPVRSEQPRRVEETFAYHRFGSVLTKWLIPYCNTLLEKPNVGVLVIIANNSTCTAAVPAMMGWRDAADLQSLLQREAGWRTCNYENGGGGWEAKLEAAPQTTLFQLPNPNTAHKVSYRDPAV